MGTDVPLLGSPAVPPYGLGRVFRQAPETHFVHCTKAKLSMSISLLGSLAVPPYGLGLVSIHSATGYVHQAEVVLGIGIPLLGRCPTSIGFRLGNQRG